MSVYKYVTPEGALRYLRSWALRITPPDQFNDPFEMRPLLAIEANALLEPAPSMVRDELVVKFSQALGTGSLHPSLGEANEIAGTLVAYLMRQLSKADEDAFIALISGASGGEGIDSLRAVRDQFGQLYEQTLIRARGEVPTFIRMAESILHSSLHKLVGVLCLSSSGQHPLMWAHYTDCHKGAVLEFDERAPCFNKRRHAEDEFGWLRRVWYSDTRPTISDKTADDSAAAVLLLTKALDWSYEQELRLVWPLEFADKSLSVDKGAEVHLIEAPHSALLSVTVGCKADPEFLSDVVAAKAAVPAATFRVRTAAIDERSFRLNYTDFA